MWPDVCCHGGCAEPPAAGLDAADRREAADAEQEVAAIPASTLALHRVADVNAINLQLLPEGCAERSSLGKFLTLGSAESGSAERSADTAVPASRCDTAMVAPNELADAIFSPSTEWQHSVNCSASVRLGHELAGIWAQSERWNLPHRRTGEFTLAIKDAVKERCCEHWQPRKCCCGITRVAELFVEVFATAGDEGISETVQLSVASRLNLGIDQVHVTKVETLEDFSVYHVSILADRCALFDMRKKLKCSSDFDRQEEDEEDSRLVKKITVLEPSVGQVLSAYSDREYDAFTMSDVIHWPMLAGILPAIGYGITALSPGTRLTSMDLREALIMAVLSGTVCFLSIIVGFSLGGSYDKPVFIVFTPVFFAAYIFSTMTTGSSFFGQLLATLVLSFVWLLRGSRTVLSSLGLIWGAFGLHMFYFLMIRVCVPYIKMFPVVQELLLPFLLLVFNCLASQLYEVLVPRILQVGSTHMGPAALFSDIVAFSEGGRLVSMLYAAVKPTWTESMFAVGACAVGSLVSDVYCRGLIFPIICERVSTFFGYKSARISPEADLWLRARFVVNYMPIVPACVTVLLANVNGAPWARNPRIFTGLVVYIIVGLVSDIMVLRLHISKQRRCPSVGEWRRAWHRLSQPREYFQGVVAQAALPQTSDWRSLLGSRSPCSWASDRRLICIPFYFSVQSVTYETMLGLFGVCHLWTPEQNCGS